MLSDPYRYFRLEARELLDQLGKEILAVERSPRPAEPVKLLLRLAHTLKGAARIVKQNEMAQLAHAIEDQLTPFRETEEAVPRDRITTVLQSIDQIEEFLTKINLVEPVTGMLPTPLPDDTPRTIRTDIGDMNTVIDGVAEAASRLNTFRKTARILEQTKHLSELLSALLTDKRTPRTFIGKAAGEHACSTSAAPPPSTQILATVQALTKKTHLAEQGLSVAIEQMDRELRQLRETAERLRLTPVDTLLTALDRTARDTAQACGKQVSFRGLGGDIRLDAHVLGTIQGALVQIVRNAVAHGIEAPGQRIAAGKPPIGQVTVDVSCESGCVVFQCSDDGRGLDLDAFRQKLGAQNGFDRDQTPLDTQSLMKQILQGGFSTADTVTEISGRGIGLDIVGTVLQRLGGNTDIQTEPNRGTRFKLTVPLSVAAIDVLTVEASNQRLNIPLTDVRGTMRLSPEQVSNTPAGTTVSYDKQAIPFAFLSSLIGRTTPPTGNFWPTVIVTGRSGIAAIGVDRLHGTAQIMVRPLPDHTPAAPIISGASLDAAGDPQLVLNADQLVTQAQYGSVIAPGNQIAPRTILVIDDSLTSRMLERSILEQAGYDVDTAQSGEEALEKIRFKHYDLFMVDVEMPGIDGFKFVETIRADPAHRHIPAIMVTSCATPKDRERGRDVGAQAHIVKSAFNQNELMTIIKPLIG